MYISLAIGVEHVDPCFGIFRELFFKCIQKFVVIREGVKILEIFVWSFAKKDSCEVFCLRNLFCPLYQDPHITWCQVFKNSSRAPCWNLFAWTTSVFLDSARPKPCCKALSCNQSETDLEKIPISWNTKAKTRRLTWHIWNVELAASGVLPLQVGEAVQGDVEATILNISLIWKTASSFKRSHVLFCSPWKASRGLWRQAGLAFTSIKWGRRWESSRTS